MEFGEFRKRRDAYSHSSGQSPDAFSCDCINTSGSLEAGNFVSKEVDTIFPDGKIASF
jgi:hypothetical protein